MLDEKFIEARKQELLKQKARLEKELGGIAIKDDGNYKPKFPKIGDDEEDNELEVSEYEQTIDAEKRLAVMLQETIEALERINNGTYGFCENCNKEIDPARLEAYPAAKTCTVCEE